MMPLANLVKRSLGSDIRMTTPSQSRHEFASWMAGSIEHRLRAFVVLALTVHLPS